MAVGQNQIYFVRVGQAALGIFLFFCVQEGAGVLTNTCSRISPLVPNNNLSIRSRNDIHLLQKI